jgi:hypothetical protein
LDVTQLLRGIGDMLDSILVAAGIGFFVVAVLYVLACDRM